MHQLFNPGMKAAVRKNDIVASSLKPDKGLSCLESFVQYKYIKYMILLMLSCQCIEGRSCPFWREMFKIEISSK